MIYMKLFNKLTDSSKLFNKSNNQYQNAFGKFAKSASKHNNPMMEKVGHFISKVNRNDLEKGSKQNTKEQQGPSYK